MIRYFVRSKQGFFLTLIDETKYAKQEDRVLRAKDISIKVGSLIHYFSMTAFYYVAFYSQENLPICMGGSSSCDDLLKGFPNPNNPLSIPWLKTFYLFQLGTNIYKLMYQAFFNLEDKTYFEYTLHHFLTMFLIAFSYLIHALKMGSFIMLIHDISDVTFLISRIYYDFKGKKMALMIPFNVISLGGWIYARLYVLPACALNSLFFGRQWDTNYPYKKDFFAVLWLEISMLSMLFIMHIFWTALIFRSLFKMYNKEINKKDK